MKTALKMLPLLLLLASACMGSTITVTFPQVCGAGYSSAPYPTYNLGPLSYSLPSDAVIMGATLSGTWGNTCYPRSTAGVDIELYGVTVAECFQGDVKCYVDQAAGLPPRPWSVDVPDTLFFALGHQSPWLSIVQTSSTFVEVGATTLTINYTSTSPVPEPSTLALLGSGALGLFGAIRRKLRG